MKRILVSSSILAMVGGAAFAGGYTAPAAAPVVTPAPMVAAPVAFDWTGAYAGAQVGYGKTNGDLDANGAVGGVHAGYLKDFGGFVGGGELAYNAANVDDGANGKLKNMTDLKLIGGVPYNRSLFYGALGASYMKADLAGQNHSDTSPMVGIGMKYAVTDQWTVGGELDYRDGHNFDGTNSDVNATTLNLTTSFKF